MSCRTVGRSGGRGGTDTSWSAVASRCLGADGSVRAYINWSATSKANGHEVNLRAYHYWNFNEEGKIMQEGGFYDAGGLAVAATTMPPAEEGEGEE